MGRHSNYKFDTQENSSSLLPFEQVKGKFGKAPMSVYEFASYIDGVKPNHLQSITDKSVKNYLRDICNMSHGALKIDDFKNPKTKRFELRENYHALLLTLMDVGFRDCRTSNSTIAFRKTVLKQIQSNLETYMPREEAIEILDSPAFTNALLEDEFSIQFSKHLANLIHLLYHTDISTRHQSMRDFLEYVNTLEKKLINWDLILDHAKNTVSLPAGSVSSTPSPHDTHRSALYDHLISVLAKKVLHPSDDIPSDASTRSDGFPSAAAIAFSPFLFQDDSIPDDLAVEVDRIHAFVEQSPKYRSLLWRLQSIMNMDDPDEALMFNSFAKIAEMTYLKNFVSANDYQVLMQFIDESEEDAKWSLHSELVVDYRLAETDWKVELFNSLENRCVDHAESPTAASDP